MANLPTPNLDYTDKDFDAILARLQNLIPSVFPQWTDYNTANFGNILIESFAFVLDVLTTYQDNQAAEAFMLTATQRKNVLALARALGFEPQGAVAAQFEETFSIANAVAGDVLIEAGTVVETADIVDPLQYQLLEDVTIAAGNTSATGTIENSESQEDTFTSDGTPNQEFELAVTPYLDGSAIVVAGNGTFTEVDTFLSSEPNDQHFTIEVDQNDRATIRFGNGTNGRVPTGSITVDYKTGGGAAANADAGTITRLQGTFTDTFGTSVQVSCTNPSTASVVGKDRQSTASIKQEAPASLRVLNRAVAREDFELVALEVAGVARALMTTSNEDAGVAENTGILYLIPTGGGNPSQALKDAVAAKFAKGGDYPSHLTFTLITDNDPAYLTIDVEAVIYFADGADKTTTAALVRSNLTTWFAPENADGTVNENVDFGFNIKDADGNPAGEIAKSDISNVVRDTTGIRKLGDGPTDFLLNNAASDVTILNREFPILGNVTLRDGDTGLLV